MNEEQTSISLKYENKKEIAKGGILGFLIGIAVIVPGISGSTIAILFRLYDKLIYAFGNLLTKFKLSVLFLLPIVGGLVLGFVLGFFSIQKLLELLPFAITALFAGLMLGAFPAVTDEIKNETKTPFKILLFIIGLAIPVLIAVLSTFYGSGVQDLSQLNYYHYLLFLFLGFAVAITQIVPGLSATALLMAFGYFKPLMESAHLSDIQNNPQILLVYLCLGVGFLIGLISCSKLLTILFEHHRKKAFFCILGLSFGSIVSMFFNPDTYSIYQSWSAGTTSMALDFGLGIAFFIIGAIASYLLVRYERNKPIQS